MGIGRYALIISADYLPSQSHFRYAHCREFFREVSTSSPRNANCTPANIHPLAGPHMRPRVIWILWRLTYGCAPRRTLPMKATDFLLAMLFAIGVASSRIRGCSCCALSLRSRRRSFWRARRFRVFSFSVIDWAPRPPFGPRLAMRLLAPAG